jgi:hypothetical protein
MRTARFIAGAALMVLAGCRGEPVPVAVPVPPRVLETRPLAMMLPLANLSGRLEQADLMTRVFQAEFVRAWPGPTVDQGEAQRLVDDLRLRDTGAPSGAQVRAIRDSSGAAFLLVGTVLESGTLRTPEGDVPSVGVALRLIDTATQRSIWAASAFRTGQDRESVFGWGRELNINRLTSELAVELCQAFRAVGPDSANGGKP